MSAPLRPSASIENVLQGLRSQLTAELNEAPVCATNHSLVYKTYSQRLRTTVAVKIIDKKALPTAVADKFLPRELMITKRARHPHLLKCLLIQEASPTKLVLVSEFCSRGTLLSLIAQEQRIKETPMGVRLFRQLIEAVHYLHGRGAVHRDIKLENILLDGNCDIRLADFGFSRFMQKRERSRSFCGTRPYSAPQIVSYNPYDGYAADWYSCGVVLYTMIVGKWPKEPYAGMGARICFPDDEVPTLACRRLIVRLMDEDEELRAGYEECIYSEWMSTQPTWLFADANFVYSVIKQC